MICVAADQRDMAAEATLMAGLLCEFCGELTLLCSKRRRHGALSRVPLPDPTSDAIVPGRAIPTLDQPRPRVAS